MSSIGEAFNRLPRPQAPTKAALLERNLKKRKEQLGPSTKKEITDSPWKQLVRQGELVQGKHTWSICLRQGRLALVTKLETHAGRQELEKVTKLSDHPNVATVKEVFEAEGSLFFQYDYTRFTLEEVLNVHSYLEEMHIRIIASAVRTSQ